MAREGESMTGTLITLGVIGAAAYLAWQWLQSACGAGGSMTGNWMCGALGVNPAAAGAQSSAPSLSAMVGSPYQTGGGFSVPFTITGPPGTNVTVSGGMFTSPTVVGTISSQGTLVGSWGLSNLGATLTVTAGSSSTTVSLPAAPTTLVAQPVSGPVVVSTPVQGASTSAGSAGSPTSVIAGTLQQLASQNAFFQQQGGEGDAYQWAALWAQAGQPNFNVNSIFYPNGIAAASGSGAGFSSGNLPLISVSQFLSALSSAGISPSGMSGINRIPAAMIHLGRIM